MTTDTKPSYLTYTAPVSERTSGAQKKRDNWARIAKITAANRAKEQARKNAIARGIPITTEPKPETPRVPRGKAGRG